MGATELRNGQGRGFATFVASSGGGGEAKLSLKTFRNSEFRGFVGVGGFIWLGLVGWRCKKLGVEVFDFGDLDMKVKRARLDSPGVEVIKLIKPLGKKQGTGSSSQHPCDGCFLHSKQHNQHLSMTAD